MLPAWLSYFAGADTPNHQSVLLRTMVRGLVVGLVLTAGFIAVFGGFGLAFETVVSRGAVLDHIGWVTIVIGIAMTGLGVWIISGRDLDLRLPRMDRGTGSRSLGSVFMFGVSYAVVSLSCTIGLFIAGVATTFTDQGYAEGVANFVAYGAGMGSVITFLTLNLALARTGIIRRMRRLLPFVTRISGLVLIGAGAYLANYGWWELQVLNDPTATNAPVEWFQTFQADISNWIADTTPERLGLVSLFGVSGALMVGWLQTEPDTSKRRSVASTYGLAYLAVEAGSYRGNFIAGPVLRFVAGWPYRTANWFTDPGRAGVAAEVFVTVVAAGLIWRACVHGARRSTTQSVPTDR